LIGCGAIGTIIAEAVAQRVVVCDELVLFDYRFERAEKLKKSLIFPTKLAPNLEEMLRLKPTVIVEAASQDAVREYIVRIIAEAIDVIVMSTGALIDLDIQSNNIHVPSGAIGGLDSLSTATLAGIDEITLTSRKNPKSLNMENQEPKIIYRGSAEEAARLFPREMNVAATLKLTVKPAKVMVQVISDPQTQRNTHEIQVKWKFGEMFLRFANDPHPENPHTSALAAWSAIRLLKSILEK
jgi:aspartate dehydrogenase